MWQMWECLETLRRTLSCLLHPPAFGSGSVWFQDEILRAAVEPYAGAASSGLLLVHHNAQPYVAGVSLQFLDGALDALKQKIHKSWITYFHFPPWWLWTQSSDCKWLDFPLIVYFVAYFIRDVFPLVLVYVSCLLLLSCVRWLHLVSVFEPFFQTSSSTCVWCVFFDFGSLFGCYLDLHWLRVLTSVSSLLE